MPYRSRLITLGVLLGVGLFAAANAGAMKFDLYGYRRDVAKGTVRMGTDGALAVDLAARSQ